jgi:hypothetical protein
MAVPSHDGTRGCSGSDPGAVVLDEAGFAGTVAGMKRTTSPSSKTHCVNLYIYSLVIKMLAYMYM